MPTTFGYNPGQVMPGTGFAEPSPGGYDPSTLPQYSAPAQNLQNFGYTAALTGLVNSLNQQGQATALAQRIPNEPGLEKQSSALVGEELAGKLPKDVMDLLAQQGAERGVATGSPGSPNSSAAYLRALGLTSLGEQQTGEANLTAAEGRNPPAPLFNPGSQLLSAAQGGGGGGTAAPGGRITMPPAGYSDVGTGAPSAAAPSPAAGAPDYTPSQDLQQAWWNTIGYGQPEGTMPTAPAPVQYTDSSGSGWSQDPESGAWTNAATGETSTLPPDLGFSDLPDYSQASA